MNYGIKFDEGWTYEEFLSRYGRESQRQRWHDTRARVTLSAEQRAVLQRFRRDMKVLCVAGVWCGDCAEQCPIFAALAAETPRIQLRCFDRDEHLDLSQELSICGGARIPVVLFLSEDNQPLGRYGDRTLSKYRQLEQLLDGVACPSGLGMESAELAAVVQDWLNEFERNQLILRLSPRLRAKYGD